MLKNGSVGIVSTRGEKLNCRGGILVENLQRQIPKEMRCEEEYVTRADKVISIIRGQSILLSFGVWPLGNDLNNKRRTEREMNRVGIQSV